MNDTIILSADEFQKIFANAYAVVANGGVMYDVYNDYETEDGESCTALIPDGDFGSDNKILIPRSLEENSSVYYNKRYHTFYFKDQENIENRIPCFKILNVATID